MKVTDVIQELEKYKDVYGDLEVKVRDSGGVLCPSTEVISWKAPVEGSRLCVCIEA